MRDIEPNRYVYVASLWFMYVYVLLVAHGQVVAWYVCVCVFVYECICVYVYMNVKVAYVCVCVYIYICMCVYV